MLVVECPKSPQRGTSRPDRIHGRDGQDSRSSAGNPIAAQPRPRRAVGRHSTGPSPTRRVRGRRAPGDGTAIRVAPHGGCGVDGPKERSSRRRLHGCLLRGGRGQSALAAGAVCILLLRSARQQASYLDQGGGDDGRERETRALISLSRTLAGGGEVGAPGAQPPAGGAEREVGGLARRLRYGPRGGRRGQGEDAEQQREAAEGALRPDRARWRPDPAKGPRRRPATGGGKKQRTPSFRGWGKRKEASRAGCGPPAAVAGGGKLE